jgi:hypothetical protein
MWNGVADAAKSISGNTMRVPATAYVAAAAGRKVRIAGRPTWQVTVKREQAVRQSETPVPRPG